MLIASLITAHVWGEVLEDKAPLDLYTRLASSPLQFSLRGNPERTRLSFKYREDSAPNMMLLENPPRLILELVDGDMSQGLENSVLERLPLEGSAIEKMSAVHTGSALRLTFTLKKGQASNVDVLTLASQRNSQNHDATALINGAGLRHYSLDIYHDKYHPELADDTQLATAAALLLTNQAPAAGGELGKQLTLTPSATERFAAESVVGDQSYPSSDPIGSSIDWGLSGTWQQELSEGRQRTQKFESLVQPRVDVDWGDGVSISAQVRLRYDSEAWLGPRVDRADNYSSLNGPWYNSAHAELSLRELYLDGEWWGSYWRLGKQQVVWGQADGLKVLDVVNPQSFREFIVDDFDDSRIPLWMLNLEVPLAEEASLQLLWIPDTTYHEWAEVGSPWQLTSPVFSPLLLPGYTPQLQPIDKPRKPIKDSDLGVRYSDFTGGWDVTLNYLYHYQDAPVYYQSLDAVAATQRIKPRYERNHLLGSTASNAFGSVTLRAELAYSSDTFHLSTDFKRRAITASAELASVLGLDWQGPETVFVSAQWFQTHLLDYRAEILRERTEHTLSLLYQQDFANEAWQLKVLALRSLNHQDSWLQVKLKYFMRSNLEVWLSSDHFSGDTRSLFGQFDQRDRFSLGFELGF